MAWGHPREHWKAKTLGTKGVLRAVSPRSPRPRGMCQLQAWRWAGTRKCLWSEYKSSQPRCALNHGMQK